MREQSKTGIKAIIPGRSLPEQNKLTHREQLILGSIVHNFIMTADPVGSRALARRYKIDLSPATIRNTMADLEEMGLLTHPHISAGRVPTDLGYRQYVDHLMEVEELPIDTRNAINVNFNTQSVEATNVLEMISGLLADVSQLLAVISTPDLSTGTLDKVALVRVSSGRIMVVIVISSGQVRNIILELKSDISDAEIEEAHNLVNQRLTGLRLVDIPRKIGKRLSAGEGSRNAVVRLFLDFPNRIFTPESCTELHIGGKRHVLDQPEYKSPENLKGIIELIEDRDIIVHLLKDREPGVSVTIGGENQDDLLKNLSVVSSKYRVGEVFGTIGIIGPTRMNYSKLVGLVDYASKMLADRVSND